jgi:uncharacterized protein
MNRNPSQKMKKTKCPICRKPVPADAETFPFCGKQCKLIDLGRWLKGDYAISRPVERSDVEESE